MKASELVTLLQQDIAAWGDKDVVICQCDCPEDEFLPIYPSLVAVGRLKEGPAIGLECYEHSADFRSQEINA